MKFAYVPRDIVAQPAWRWARVLDLAEGGPPDMEDDALIARALMYWTGRQQAQGPGELRLLASKFPDIHQAYDLFLQQRRLRHVMEGLYLGGVENQDIACILALPLPTVCAYLGLFFDLPSRDKKEGFRVWACLNLLHPAEQRGQGEDYAVMCWRLGLTQPVQALLDFAGKFVASEETPEIFAQMIQDDLLWKLFRELPNVEITEKNFAKLYRFCQQPTTAATFEPGTPEYEELMAVLEGLSLVAKGLKEEQHNKARAKD